MSTRWLGLGTTSASILPGDAAARDLLTDGRTQRRRRSLAAIGLCEGVFRCDCRGVGTDWEVSELRKISTALLATVDIVPDPGRAGRRLPGDDARRDGQGGRRALRL